MTKFRCERCAWHGIKPLRADHPFDDTEYVLGCPDCLGMEIARACDREDCWATATCILPPNYLCGHHYRMAEAGK